MPRNISFALTTEQFLDGSKDVTRRMGWLMLVGKAGVELQGCRKCMGLKPGEKLERLRRIETVDVRREKLSRMIDEPSYGLEEVRREGFPGMDPADFVEMFCASHDGCTPDAEVTRIEYRYVDG